MSNDEWKANEADPEPEDDCCPICGKPWVECACSPDPEETHDDVLDLLRERNLIEGVQSGRILDRWAFGAAIAEWLVRDHE